MTDTVVEDAYHRLDGRFLGLSDEAVRSRPTAGLHLYRAAAARLWQAPLDPMAELAAAQQLVSQPSEKSLVAAMDRFLTRGPAAAADLFVEHAEQYPGDHLAAGLRNASLVLSGVSGNRERLFRVTEREAARKSGDWRFDSGFAMVLQEQRRYDQARQVAESALRAEPASAHAVHAVAHLNYETGEHTSGIAWLDEWQEGRNMLGYAAHFRWHTALHALALGDVDGALARYREGIGPTAVPDAGSLLWRCRLAGRPMTGLAGEAAEVAGPVLDSLPVPFAVFCACLAMAAVGDSEGLRGLASRLAADPRPGFADVVAPVALALGAAVDGQWSEAASQLSRVLAELPRIGGSNAQREVAEDTYIYALMSSGRAEAATDLLRTRLARREHALDRRQLQAMERSG